MTRLREKQSQKIEDAPNAKTFFNQWAHRIETVKKDPDGNTFITYAPSVWTRTFLKGMEQLVLPPRPRILEVGVGTGIATAFALTKWRDAHVFGTDIVKGAIQISKKNISSIVGEDALNRCSLLVGDLASFFKEYTNNGASFNAIVGCLPMRAHAINLKELKERNLTPCFYDPRRYTTHQGAGERLGLCSQLLREARAILPPGGKMLLTSETSSLLRALMDLFEHNGFKCRVTAEDTTESEEGQWPESVCAVEGTRQL